MNKHEFKLNEAGQPTLLQCSVVCRAFRPILGMRIKSITHSPILEERGFRWIGTWQLVKDLGGNNWHELVDENWQCKTCGTVHKYPYYHTCKH